MEALPFILSPSREKPRSEG